MTTPGPKGFTDSQRPRRWCDARVSSRLKRVRRTARATVPRDRAEPADSSGETKLFRPYQDGSPESLVIGRRRRERRRQLAVRAVPDAQHAILAARDDDPSVGRCRGGMHEVRGAGERTNLVAIFFDQSDFAVTGRDEGLVRVTDETDRSHFFVGTADVLLTVARREVPEFDDIVSAGAGQGSAILF